MATESNINITAASLRGSPSDRIIKPRPRKDSLQSISGSDSHPGRVVKPRARKSPGSGAKRSEPAKRKFICSFSHYGCDVALSSKNEWKRHVSIQHLQLGFYRCDVGSCNPDLNPTVPGHKRVYNDFNRKDLFTQHHRRMHKPESGPGSGNFPPGNESSKDWRAFEDSLESVRQRCWVERRKPPQRSTCGFCGRVFEGEGSWNERMEHVGSHFSRDVIEAKEEREDEDLTNWAVQENIIKEGPNGRHVLIDQSPSISERPYVTRDREVNMGEAPSQGQEVIINHNVIDPNINNPSAYGDQYQSQSPDDNRRMSNNFPLTPTTNGTNRPTSASVLPPPHHPTLSFGSALAPAPGSLAGSNLAPALSPRGSGQAPMSPTERRRYDLAPPPLSQGSQSTSPTSPSRAQADTSSGDRLEDLINQLIKPKGPKTQRRLTWKCDCGLELSVGIDEADANAVRTLEDISIICAKTSNAYLKNAKTGGKHTIVKCNELEGYVWREAKLKVRIERAGDTTAQEVILEDVEAEAQAEKASQALADLAKAGEAEEKARAQ